MGKGFGQPSAVPTRNATKFMRAFGQCCAQAKADKKPVNQFLKSNVAKLNNALLEALPLVFTKLSTDERLKDRQNVASLFGVFGNALQDFPLGDRALNLELSITAYQVALKVFTRDAFPEKWAGTQNNLGNAYRDRIRGERSENVEQAIAAYELA
ncbi:MAG: tetratricopeptide repeat protein, partial [Leptolyngbya sp. SIO1D8]|nr:tetratricopeptide repeat protein [Leptolyngbya sp. SIO1D8]